MAVDTLLAQTAPEVADAKETYETHLYRVDGVSSQERAREYPQMPHLLKKDVAIEWAAWLVVVGLLFVAIRLAGML